MYTMDKVLEIISRSGWGIHCHNNTEILTQRGSFSDKKMSLTVGHGKCIVCNIQLTESKYPNVSIVVNNDFF